MSSEFAVRDDIVHRSRHTMFGGATGTGDWLEEGIDLSGAAFVMTLAAEQGASALVTLTTQSAGTEGVSASYDADYENAAGVNVGATTITAQIDETTLEGLTWGDDPAAPLVLEYDLLVTPSGAPQQLYYYGSFTLYPGVGD